MPTKRTQKITEIAEVFDVHENTVRSWIHDGCPNSRRKGAYYLDDGEAQDWLNRTGRKMTPGRPVGPKAEVPEELGGNKDYWLARKYRNACLREERELIPEDELRQMIGEHYRILSAGLVGLPAEVTPHLEGRDAAERQTILEQRIREKLEWLASAIERFCGFSPATATAD